MAKNKQKTNYYDLFIMGLIFLGAGIPLAVTTKNWGLLGIGFVFMIAGLSKRKEWAVKGRSWDQLSDKEKRKQIIALRIFLILFAVGILLFFIFRLFF